MLNSFVLTVSGAALILIPHYVCPLGYIEGREGAQIQTICSLWEHPEVYLGALTVITSIISFKRKKTAILTLILGTAAIAQAFTLKPTGFYLMEQEKLLVYAQTITLRSHRAITETIAALGALIALFSTLILRKTKTRKHVNLFRIVTSSIEIKKFRWAALTAVFAIVTCAVFSNLFLYKALKTNLSSAFDRLNADIAIIPKNMEQDFRDLIVTGEPKIFYMDKKTIVNKILSIEGVETITSQLYIKPYSYTLEETVVNALIIGFNRKEDFVISPWIDYNISDDSLSDDSSMSDGLFVGRAVKYYPGQSIEVLGRKLTVLAALTHTGLGFIDNSVFVPIETVKEIVSELKSKPASADTKKRRKPAPMAMDFSHIAPVEDNAPIDVNDIDPEKNVSALFVKLRSNYSRYDFLEKLNEMAEDVSFVNLHGTGSRVKKAIKTSAAVLYLPSAVIVLMGAFVVLIAFSVSVNERMRDIGIFRSMGAKKSDIFAIFILEAILIALMGSIIGIIGGSALLILFKEYIMETLNVVSFWRDRLTILKYISLTTTVSLVCSITAALAPALRASLLEPYKAVRKGQ
ncbi:ABC transporter permease [Candidatus Magnetoovum chiemensis]|nr:ABC transporter permease [Candidatus Magnetoovum chiemensis]